MFVLLNSDKTFNRVLNTGEDLLINNTRHPKQIYKLWSETELKVFEIYKVKTFVVLTEDEQNYHDNVFDYVHDNAADEVNQVLVSSTPRSTKTEDKEADRIDAIDNQLSATSEQVINAIDDIYDTLVRTNTLKEVDLLPETVELFSNRDTLKKDKVPK